LILPLLGNEGERGRWSEEAIERRGDRARERGSGEHMAGGQPSPNLRMATVGKARLRLATQGAKGKKPRA